MRVAVDCGETDPGDMREKCLVESLWGEMPVVESQATMEARRYC